MSLINKMLGDLEKRDAFLYEKQNNILDGLYSAYDLELNKRNKKNNRFLIFAGTAFVISIFAMLLFLKTSSIEQYMYIPSNIDTSDDKSGFIQEEVKTNLVVKSTISNSKLNNFLKLDDGLLEKALPSTIVATETNGKNLNKIENIYFEPNEQGINLVIKMPREIDYLVYGLSNPNRIVIEVDNAELGFLLEELEPIDPIVAVRYSINKQNRFKLVLESEQLLTIRKSTTGEDKQQHDLVVMMEYQWQENNKEENIEDALVSIVEQQVNDQKEIVFKGELIKTQRNQNGSAYTEKLFKQAYADYKNGNIKNSLKKLNMVLDEDASHVQARSTLALILSKQGHINLAYSVLNEGLIQYPKQSEWITMTARLLLGEDKMIQAKELLSSHKPEFSTNLEYYALLGAILQKLNEHNDSARIYRDLLQVNPSKSVWWMGLGISLESLKRYEDALYAYQKAYKNPSFDGESRNFVAQRINMLSNLIKDEST